MNTIIFVGALLMCIFWVIWFVVIRAIIRKW
jgi:hypothetical protein